MQLEWRYANAEDVRAYYGRQLTESINAVVVLLDDEPVGIIGISHERGMKLFFSEFDDCLAPYLSRITVARALLAVVDIVKKQKIPVLAVTETDEGHATLQRLGFDYIGEGHYQWIS